MNAQTSSFRQTAKQNRWLFLLSQFCCITRSAADNFQIMARLYRLGFWRKLTNRIVNALLRLGMSPPRTYLLTVPGRKSGRLYSTPVTLVEENSQRWLVSPYGEVGWVQNARAAGEVTLRRGSRSETLRIIELPPAEAGPVLKKYLTQAPIVRPFFDVSAQSDIKDFIAEAPRHPVFKIVR
jgi:deazaflavin-dependent oxidoreductase (nitroreductase family)